jgi:MazG family protein
MVSDQVEIRYDACVIDTSGMDDFMKIDKLLAIVAALRDPETGCPWDIKQDFSSISRYTIEEAYEVGDAIERGDTGDLQEELGDLLFQVALHAQIASEQALFDFHDIVEAICDKMVRRHPHVFAASKARTDDEILSEWEQIKAEERAAKASGKEDRFADIALGLPALMRAVKLQNRAARAGFDWPDLTPVMAKLHEELGELEEAIAENHSNEAIAEELGDMMFVLANVARHLGMDPECCTRQANAKFQRRFNQIEQMLAARGRTPEQSSLSEMDELWDMVKLQEKT